MLALIPLSSPVLWDDMINARVGRLLRLSLLCLVLIIVEPILPLHGFISLLILLELALQAPVGQVYRLKLGLRQPGLLGEVPGVWVVQLH